MSLRHRLERLETRIEGGRGRPCESCGAGYGPVEYTVEWDEPEQYQGPERCPECGRRLVHIITWHDSGGAA